MRIIERDGSVARLMQSKADNPERDETSQAACGSPVPVAVAGRGRRLLVVLPVLVPLVFFVWTGAIGLDFGEHWDEGFHRTALLESASRGILLPSFYHYPSLGYWLSVASVLPDVAATLSASDSLLNVSRQDVSLAVRRSFAPLRLRAIYLGLAALAVLWIYLAVLASGGRWGEGLLAAGLLACSWEFGYHARWIAPDAVVLQFAALTILMVALVRRADAARWRRMLGWAAVAASLAFATKYPAGLLIVPVWLAAVVAARRHECRRALAGVLLWTTVIFGAVFLLVTPGAVLEPLLFFQDAYGQYVHYAALGHAGHSIEPGWPHLRAAGVYLFGVLFSPWMPVAVLLSLLIVPGVASLWRRDARYVLVLLAFPVAYLVFMSAQRVLIVRNLLVVAPFLALFAARGGAWLWGLGGRPMRIAVLVGLSGALGAGAVWQYTCARSIRTHTPYGALAHAVRYVGRRPDVRFGVSPPVAAAVRAAGLTLPPNAETDLAGPWSQMLWYASEARSARCDWPANDPRLMVTWFGPWEANLDYYPDWRMRGDRDRLLVMTRSKLERLPDAPAGGGPG